jgi:hypothetical protein
MPAAACIDRWRARRIDRPRLRRSRSPRRTRSRRAACAGARPAAPTRRRSARVPPCRAGSRSRSVKNPRAQLLRAKEHQRVLIDLDAQRLDEVAGQRLAAEVERMIETDEGIEPGAVQRQHRLGVQQRVAEREHRVHRIARRPAVAATETSGGRAAGRRSPRSRPPRRRLRGRAAKPSSPADRPPRCCSPVACRDSVSR